MNELDEKDSVAAAVDAVFEEAAAERAYYRDTAEALAIVSVLIDAAEADSRQGNHAAGRRLEPLLAPLQELADALGGGRAA